MFSGNYEGYEEAVQFLISIISRHYNIPFFSKYFNNRTLEDLVFETELIRLQTVPAEQRTAQIIANNKQEAVDLFDDMEEEDNQELMNDTEFEKIAKSFMDTGNFKE